jgi:hypothetical protein
MALTAEIAKQLPPLADASGRQRAGTGRTICALKKSNASQGKIEVGTNQTGRIRRIFG